MQLAALNQKTRPLSVECAIDAFKGSPQEPVTIQFVVGRVSWLGWSPPNEDPGHVYVSPCDKSSSLFRAHIDPLRAAELVLPSEVAADFVPVAVEKPEAPSVGSAKSWEELRGKTVRVTGQITRSLAQDGPPGTPESYEVAIPHAGELQIVD